MRKKNEITTEKGSRKNDLLKTLVDSALLVALGVLLLLRPDFATTTMASIIGWVLLGGGAILIAITILNWDVMGVLELVAGIAAASVGLFIVIAPHFLADAFGVLIGIYLGFQAISTLVIGLRQRRAGRAFWPTLILGLVLLGLTLLLILVPLNASRFLVQVIGLLMGLSGLAYLVLRSTFYLSRPQKNLSIVEARDDD